MQHSVCPCEYCKRDGVDGSRRIQHGISTFIMFVWWSLFCLLVACLLVIVFFDDDVRISDTLVSVYRSMGWNWYNLAADRLNQK